MEVDGGRTWRLQAPGCAEQLIGRRLTVTGTRIGFDQLAVEEICVLDAPPVSRSWWRRLFG